MAFIANVIVDLLMFCGNHVLGHLTQQVRELGVYRCISEDLVSN